VKDNEGPIVSYCSANGENPLTSVEGTGFIDLTALIDDTSTGNSNIVNAEYFISIVGPAGSGYPMTASDLAYDSPIENVEATVDTSLWSYLSSPYFVYVHGEDEYGNWGDFCVVTIIILKTNITPTLEVPLDQEDSEIILVLLLILTVSFKLFSNNKFREKNYSQQVIAYTTKKHKYV